jgi:hypothetical protein
MCIPPIIVVGKNSVNFRGNEELLGVSFPIQSLAYQRKYAIRLPKNSLYTQLNVTNPVTVNPDAE